MAHGNFSSIPSNAIIGAHHHARNGPGGADLGKRDDGPRDNGLQHIVSPVADICHRLRLDIEPGWPALEQCMALIAGTGFSIIAMTFARGDAFGHLTLDLANSKDSDISRLADDFSNRQDIRLVSWDRIYKRPANTPKTSNPRCI